VDQVFGGQQGGSGGKEIFSAHKSRFLKKFWKLDKSADKSDPDTPINQTEKMPWPSAAKNSKLKI
jgi:hypothetical protein